MLHTIKILDSFYKPVVMGYKTFEIRDNSDRGFQRGDNVEMHEINKLGIKTGNKVFVQITYVSDYNQTNNQVVFPLLLKV